MEPSYHWKQHWLVEAVRLKESQWGPIEDTVEVRRAIAAGGSFTARLLLRASLLSQRTGWVELQQRMLLALRFSLIILSVLFVFIGLGVALGALATQDGRVNILAALVALLGLPTLSLLLWFSSFFIRSGSGNGGSFGLSQLWLWLSQRIVKGPDQGLLLNALFSFGSKQRLLRWVFSAVNHWLWLLALLAATLTMLALLAAKRYYFNWETTLLATDSFVSLVQNLGVLPSFLGFLTPSEAVIRQSDGLQLLPAAAQVEWSSWLVGCLVVYGVIPRFMVLVWSLFFIKQRQQPLEIDINQLGVMELRQRLLPQTESVGIDALAGIDQVPEAKVLDQRPPLLAKTLLIGVELAHAQVWPPYAATALPAIWQNAGLVDSREQRAEVLVQLTQGTFEHVVLCVDAAQTPDRGVVAWLAELASYGRYCSVCLVNTPHDGVQLETTELVRAWFSRLNKAGFSAVYTDFEQLLTDLD